MESQRSRSGNVHRDFRLRRSQPVQAARLRALREMQIGAFVIRINNRRLLQGFYINLGIPDDKVADVLRVVDKIDKIGRERVQQDLITRLGVAEAHATAIVELAGMDAPTDELLNTLRNSPSMSNATFAQGVNELSEVVAGVRSLGVPDDYFKVDLTIARGLGYYTGTVYETRLLAHPELGSICSGGRYDDLASFFTTDKLPGVGISIGYSRFMMTLIENGVLPAGSATPAKVLVTVLDPAQMQHYLRIAADLRGNAIPTEVYLEKGRLGDQLKYASRKGFRLAVIAGESEFASDQVKLKDLATGTETVCGRDALTQEITARLKS